MRSTSPPSRSGAPPRRAAPPPRGPRGPGGGGNRPPGPGAKPPNKPAGALEAVATEGSEQLLGAVSRQQRSDHSVDEQQSNLHRSSILEMCRYTYFSAAAHKFVTLAAHAHRTPYSGTRRRRLAGLPCRTRARGRTDRRCPTGGGAAAADVVR